MKQIGLFILIFVISTTFCFSQKEAYNWYFGEYSGITFNTPSVEPIGLLNGSMLSAEGCASISDDNGKLLFYTNGETVWNKNHTPMSNGSGLGGSHLSSQSAVIVPKPGSNNIFYIFTTDTIINTGGLKYSEIDVSQNSGMGNVSTKNNFIFAPSTEKIVAVKHANGRDWWLIAHEWNSDVFRTYAITSSGIATNPIFSIAGTTHNGFSENRSGYLKASLNGTKLALAIGGGRVELFDFNNSTGRIFNPIKLSSLVFNGAYGIEFSSDGSKLYVSKSEIPSAIFQFDLSDWTPTGILNTQSLIAQINTYGEFGAIQIGPNRKIYIARNNRKYLSSITYPDSLGKQCGFIDSSVYLNERKSLKGLPNYNSQLIISQYLSTNSPVCIGDSIRLKSQYIFGAKYYWSGPLGFTSNLQSPVVYAKDEQQSGYYSLKVEISGITYYDSINVIVKKNPQAILKLYGSSVQCDGDSIKIEVQSVDNDIKCLWSNGDTSRVINARAGKQYWVEIINSGGCRIVLDTSIGIKRVSTEIYWTGSTDICKGDSILLYALPIIPGATLLWSTGETSQRITIFQTSRVTLKVTTPDGCVKIDTIDIKVHDILKVQLNPSLQKYYCEGDSLILGSNYTSPDFNYLWSNGSRNQSKKITKSEKGWLYVSLKSGCGDTAYYDVKFTRKPLVSVTTDKISPVCSGERVKLKVSCDLPDCSFLWSNGITDSENEISESGRYSVKVVSDSGCEVEEYIDFEFLNKPDIKIVPDGSARQCEGNVLLLNISTKDSNLTYLWSTGDRTDRILVNQSGNYSVIAINPSGCLDTAVIDVEFFQKPLPEIVSSGPLTLCKGNILTISTKNKYKNYRWNTGDTTESIQVNSAGTYQVTIIDSNGCSGISNSLTVRISDVNVNIINLSNIKFGNVCVKSSKRRTFTIQNDGIDAILLDSVISKNGIMVLTPGGNLPFFITTGSSLPIDIEFNPKLLGEYTDTIVIRITSPCFSEFKLVSNGTGIASAEFYSKDTTLAIGTHVCIPFYLKLNCADSLTENLSLSTDIKFDASSFYPDEQQGNWVVSKNRTENYIFFNIEKTLVGINSSESKVFDLCGTVLYGDFEWSDITSEELVWDNPYMSSISRKSELGVYSVCYFDIGHIKTTGFSKIEKISMKGDDLYLSLVSSETGTIKVSLFDLNRREIYESELTKNSEKIEQIDYSLNITGIANGCYLVMFTTPRQVIGKPIIIYR